MVDPIFVTGAAGTTGSALVRLLANRGVPVRAGVHTPAEAPDYGEGVEVVGIDLSDRDALTEAFDGSSRLFLLTPFAPDFPTLVETAVEAAEEVGIDHVVRLSAIGADAPTMLPARWHREAEQVVEESGLAYTHLRPTFFMQNLLMQTDRIADGAFYGMVSPTVGVSHVDTRDVARVAATVLTEDGHEGEAYTLTGPTAVSYDDIAETLSAVTGRTVSYVQVSEADQRAALTEMGMPDLLVDAYVELQQWAETGSAGTVRSTVEDVTGAPPTSFESFARDHAEAFGASEDGSPATA